jgi:ATP-dependent RNA helicase DHX8/PRP22
MAENDLYSLEVLSLVAKITQEIDNYLNLNDKTLAEFVISLHDQSQSLPDFKSNLESVGAGFPDSLIENVDRLILSLHPKHKKKFSTGTNGAQTNGDAFDREKDKQKRLFPGLAVPDKEVPKDVLMKEVDDMMAQFEGVAKKGRTADEEKSAKPQRRDRSRSRSPRRRSPSPDRGRSYGRRDDWRGRNGDARRTHLDERPVIFKIYSGRISSLKDFGAFVQLEGVAGRVEGEQKAS